MILLLGASGYIGEAFAREIGQRKMSFRVLSRGEVDYSKFDTFYNFLRDNKPEFVVNAAGFTGRPNVDACEIAKADTLQGNTILPATIAHACAAAGVPWGHVSSGCIYSGAKIQNGPNVRVEKDMTSAANKELIEKHPQDILGFSELDQPNFTFRDGPCSFYSGSKALGEEAIAGVGQSYIWRLRIPFDDYDNGRNYLSKVQRYSKVYDNINSISHRADFAKACMDLWDFRAPFGTYNVTNPGWVTTRQVIEAIERILQPDRRFGYWANDEEFYRVAAKTPRSNCVMDVRKLLSAGVNIRPVMEAIEDSLKNWKPERK